MTLLRLQALLLSILSVQGQLELKSVLKNCLDKGGDLSSCLKVLGEELKPYMKTGIPELGIPRTEPMDIEKIDFKLKSPVGTVDTIFTENQVSGLSDHIVERVVADKVARTLSVRIFVKEAVAKGLYHLNGVLGPITLDGSLPPAPYTTTFTGTTVDGVAKLAIVNNKLVIDGQPEVTIDVKGLNVHMENLFGGKADSLAKLVLRFVNNESDKFIEDFQPEIAKQVSSLIKGFFNSALANIPVSVFQ